MKTSLPLLFLLFCVLILISSVSVATWLSAQCADFHQSQSETKISAPQLHHESEHIFTKYKKIKTITLINSGGRSINRCEGYNLPEGLRVEVSPNQSTCVLLGIPIEAQALTPGFIVATNLQGSSLAKAPIAVNALVFVE